MGHTGVIPSFSGRHGRASRYFRSFAYRAVYRATIKTRASIIFAVPPAEMPEELSIEAMILGTAIDIAPGIF